MPDLPQDAVTKYTKVRNTNARLADAWINVRISKFIMLIGHFKYTDSHKPPYNLHNNPYNLPSHMNTPHSFPTLPIPPYPYQMHNTHPTLLRTSPNSPSHLTPPMCVYYFV